MNDRKHFWWATAIGVSLSICAVSAFFCLLVVSITNQHRHEAPINARVRKAVVAACSHAPSPGECITVSTTWLP